MSINAPDWCENTNVTEIHAKCHVNLLRMSQVVFELRVLFVSCVFSNVTGLFKMSLFRGMKGTWDGKVGSCVPVGQKSHETGKK